MTSLYIHRYNDLLNRINEMAKGFDFSDLEDSIAKIKEIAKSTKEQVDIPMNIIVEEDRSNTIEIAVPGKTKNDIILEGGVEDGATVLYVKWAEKPEKTAEEIEAEKKRIVAVNKIKKMEKAIRLTIPKGLDSSKLKANVRDGLLTIKIPAADEVKPKTFIIED